MQKENFDGLLELEHYHTPLSDSDKSLLRAQYTTLCILGFELVEPILQAGKPKALKHINRDVLYQICTTEEHYSGLQEIIQYAFRFLLRDCNECTVESAIGDIDYVKGGKGTRRSTLTYANHQEQMLLRKNGPHTLFSADLRKEALDHYFQNKDQWNFIVSRHLASMPSAVFASKLRKAKDNDNCCF